MPLYFNSLLRDADIPFTDVRLVRHKVSGARKGQTPYELWRDKRKCFEEFQSVMGGNGRTQLRVPYWASFVGTPDGQTLFVGLYGVEFQGPLQHDTPDVVRGRIVAAGSAVIYQLTLIERFADLDGKLYIDWGPGKLTWIQRADQQDKQIVELRREFKEPEFPGYLHFAELLSRLDRLPPGWITTLRSSRGVYLLTCPKTKEQYVGSATGDDGFWGRWQAYAQTGHGGNIALMSRDPSDYQVSILEVAGTAATSEEIVGMETCWKRKLQSREMGLNRN